MIQAWIHVSGYGEARQRKLEDVFYVSFSAVREGWGQASGRRDVGGEGGALQGQEWQGAVSA